MKSMKMGAATEHRWFRELQKYGAFSILLALSSTAAPATNQILLEPFFYYTMFGDAAQTYATTLTGSWSLVQGIEDSCTTNGYGTTCQNVQNLHPNTSPYAQSILDGIYFDQSFDLRTCFPGGNCNTSSNWGSIDTSYKCPTITSGASVTEISSTPYQTDAVWCPYTFPTQVSPKDCCIADPIFPATGQEMEVEADYSGASGLSFVRTYRSNAGSFASVASTSFIDFSQNYGTTIPACFQGWYKNPETSALVPYCFPYYPNATSMYELLTEDGRFIPFSGPNSAVTQAADVNERVTQIQGPSGNEWQVKREDDTTELYSAAGLLLQRTLRGGRTFTYTYTSGGQLATESDAFGHTLSWQYNAGGQMTQMTDPAGGIYQYSYNANGNLSGVTYPDSSSRGYLWNESAYMGGASYNGALTGILDEAGNRYTTISYQAGTSYLNGIVQATGSQHAGGVDNYTVSYPSPTNSATVTDPLGTSRTYEFSVGVSYDQEYSVSQPAASGSGTVSESFQYDHNGNVTQLTDFNGNNTTHTYDLTRNLETSRTEAYNTSHARTITTVWDTNWRQPDLISVYNGGTASGTPLQTTAYTYDGNGNVLTKTITDTSVTPNATRTWTYTYDTYGRMLTAQGPRTDVNSTTTYAYYTCTTGSQCGELQTVTDPVGNLTTYNTYNAHGQPLTITDPNGVVTTLTYDARARLTSRQIGTETTTFSYYSTGLLKQVTLPDSSFVLYTYDNAHRLIEISDGAGNSIQYTLDNMGNRTAEKTYDPSNTLHRTHTRTYTSLNTLYQDVNAANSSAVTTTYAYDNDTNQTSINAPLSRNSANVFDQLNRLAQITDPNGGVTTFGYDAIDDLTSVKDPKGLTTSYSYNGFKDVVKLVSPDTGTSTTTYDSGGNVSVTTDARGSTANYSYDAANRVTQIVYKNSGGVADQTIAFGYDSGTNGKGRLTSAADANHSLSWTYDFAGRVTGKGLTIGTVTESVGYGYSNGDLTALTTPSGQAVVYSYNSDHQITGITVNGTQLLSSVTYEPFGGVNGWTWGDGTTVSRTFNGDGLISQIVTAGVTLGYSFDNANRITGISDSSNSALTWSYGYDLLDRLTSASTSANTYGWTYDANGNRLTQTGTNPTTFAVNSTNNQIADTTGTLVRTYVYDAAGNTEGFASDVFTYNNRGRMNATSGNSTNYLYNALGQMIQKSGGAGTTTFMDDGAGHLIGEYNGTGGLIEETIWMGDIPVATIQPDPVSGVDIYYVQTDHLNAPRKVQQPTTDTLAWRWDADPFGTATPNQNPSGLGTFTYNLRFPGQYYQAETGLNYNYHRDYDPQLGGYIESDPMGQEYGLNPYLYVDDFVTALIDPFGLYECVPGANCNGFTPDFIRSLQCFDACTRSNTRITCGTDHHPPNDPHSRGLAADIGRNANPSLSRPDAERCYRQCFDQNSSYAQEEHNQGPGTHFHIQATPGRQGATGFRQGVAPHG